MCNQYPDRRNSRSAAHVGGGFCETSVPRASGFYQYAANFIVASPIGWCFGPQTHERCPSLAFAMHDVYRGLFAPVALIGLIHIIGGVAVLVAPQAAYVSQLSGPMMVLPYPIVIAVGLILVGAMAVAARLLKMSERTRVVLIAPQQIVLLIQLMGVGVAAWNGAYPDGYIPVPGNWWASFWFILGDQAALVVLCLSHTFEFTTLKAFRFTTPAQYEAQLAEKSAFAAALTEERDTLERRVKGTHRTAQHGQCRAAPSLQEHVVGRLRIGAPVRRGANV